MSIVKMQKLDLIGFEEDKENIIKALMKAGTVHIVDSREKLEEDEWNELVHSENAEELIAEIDEKLARIKSAIEYLSKYSTAKKALFAPKRKISEGEYNTVRDSESELWKVIETIEQYNHELTGLKSEENALRNLISSLEPWESLVRPLEITETEKVLFAIGTVPASVNIAELEQELEGQAPESFIEVVNQDKNQLYISVAYHKDISQPVTDFLKGIGFSGISFRGLTGTASENILSLNNKIKKIEEKREEIHNKSKECADYIAKLETFYDCLVIERDRKKAMGRLLNTQRTFILEGWVPESEAGKIEKLLTKHWDCVVDIRNPEKGEDFPILLKNNPLVRPFEMITEMYSLPSPNEIDPNLFLAPFYFIFFGMMVSDAGYGILLSLITGIVLLKFKLEGLAEKLIKLLFLGGISTLFWGAMFGGWFGNVVDVITQGKFTIPPIWFNPLDNPMKLLIWSFVFGVVHIFTAMGLKGYLMIREKKYLDALFDIGFWYVFLLGLCFLLLGGNIAVIGKYMAIAGAILLILTQGRSKKNILSKLFSGVLSLYNVASFLSDVLSYSRLLALGLSTGVVATVINTMGSLFGFNPIGIILFIIIFVIGSVFNMAINVLGAYVHTSRLQYVEFFGKFYEGGGKPYNPLKIKTKYIDFTNINKEA